MVDIQVILTLHFDASTRQVNDIERRIKAAMYDATEELNKALPVHGSLYAHELDWRILRQDDEA